MRLLRLLLVLALLAWTGVNAASKCEEECKPQAQKGFHREQPKCECGSGYYRSCTNGAYYAHTPTMCIYASRQEFTHEEAGKFCAKQFENSGFLAFVEDWDESYHIAHHVWNDLKQGVEGDETHYWLGGKYTQLERTEKNTTRYDKIWSFDYRGYSADVPYSLFSNESRTAAEAEGRHCLAGHTKDYDKLYAKDCNQKFPAVCYYYRETAGQYTCPQHDGTWVLFRGKCYYRYSGATLDDYKSWFQARDACLKMNAALVSIHDQATNDMMMEVSAGNELIKSWDEATWIGLQTGCVSKDEGTNQCKVPAGCYWRVGERPRIDESDKDPTAVDACNTTFSDTFPGQWEDGRKYNHTEVTGLWARGEPNEKPMKGREKCLNSTNDGSMPDDNGQSRAYCLRGVNGTADFYEHCAQIFPGDESKITDYYVKRMAMKWNDFYCFFRNRGYICERNAVKTSANDEL